MPFTPGDVYWFQPQNSGDESPRIPHPHVVIAVRDDGTVTLCAITSNLKRVSMPGNVLLDAGEANLERQSVVEVSKVSVADTLQLGGRIGALTAQRVEQILAGIRFVETAFLNR